MSKLALSQKNTSCYKNKQINSSTTQNNQNIIWCYLESNTKCLCYYNKPTKTKHNWYVIYKYFTKKTTKLDFLTLKKKISLCENSKSWKLRICYFLCIFCGQFWSLFLWKNRYISLLQLLQTQCLVPKCSQQHFKAYEPPERLFSDLTDSL